MTKQNFVSRRIILGFCATAVGATLGAPALASCSYPAAPGTDWSDCDLRGVNLDGLNLAGVILTGAIWSDGTFCAIRSVGECRMHDGALAQGIPIASGMSGMGGLAYSN